MTSLSITRYPNGFQILQGRRSDGLSVEVDLKASDLGEGLALWPADLAQTFLDSLPIERLRHGRDPWRSVSIDLDGGVSFT